MKINTLQQTRRLTTLAGALAMALASVSVSNATVITQTFTATTDCGPGVADCGTSGGIVTFTDYLEPGSGLLANQLKITFDNTTIASDVGGGYLNSSVIDGIVFNINQNIANATIASFVDGTTPTAQSIPNYVLSFNVNNNITPGNTVFEIGFDNGPGIIDGIRNAADPGSEITNTFPDIATLILTITDPAAGWMLTGIGNSLDFLSNQTDDGDDSNNASVLRMQRVGTNGAGSLKIVTSTSTGNPSSNGTTGNPSSNGTPAPEPGMLGLIGVGLLGQALLMRQRRRRLPK